MYTCKITVDKRGISRRNFYKNGKRVAMKHVPQGVIKRECIRRSHSVPNLKKVISPPPKVRPVTPSRSVHKITELKRPRKGGVGVTQGTRQYQEDRYSIVEIPGATIYSVFDGHGGALSSTLLAKDFNKLLAIDIKSRGISTRNFKDIITSVATKYDTILAKRNVTDGSTGTGAIVTATRIYLWTIGDSRSVVVNSQGKVIAKTIDHKPETDKARIIRSGGKVTTVGIPRVNGVLAVSRSFGDFSLKSVSSRKNINYNKSPVGILPMTVSVARKPGMKILVGSDGIWDAPFVPEEIINYIKKGGIKKVLKETSYFSGDNATLIYVEL